jgi:spore maturation protein CgeB
LVLAEHSADLSSLFRVGEEVDSWSTPGELVARVQHWLARPDEAAALAGRGREAVLARHTVQHRVDHMLARAGLSR